MAKCANKLPQLRQFWVTSAIHRMLRTGKICRGTAVTLLQDRAMYDYSMAAAIMTVWSGSIHMRHVFDEKDA